MRALGPCTVTVMRSQDSIREDMSQRVQRRLVEFVRHAKANDFTVGIAEELDAQRVALVCGIDNPEQLRWGLRSLLCAEHEEWERFDGLFDAYWMPVNVRSQVQSGSGKHGHEMQHQTGAGQGMSGQPDHSDEESVADGHAGSRGGASVLEWHEQGDFHALANAGQMRAMERLVESLARRMRRRLVRRERIQRKGRRLSLRHTLRSSLSFGGTPMRLVYRAHRKRQPRLILITDVSRSMAMYSFLFLRFARGIVNAFKDAAAFACHTRLVQITDALRQPDQSRVTQSLRLISQGWSGGTRLGESLATFNREYGRMLNSRTVVIIVSDGLDTGAPEALAAELSAMRSRCRKLVWLNPLIGKAGYEPRTRAMLAAMPHLDLFASAHNLQSLAALEPVLAEL